MNRYELMFNDYVVELDRAWQATAAWWERLLAREAARGNSPDQALEQVQRRWPLGPTGHPLVLAVYRKFYMACEALNDDVMAAYLRRQHQAEEGANEGWGVEEPTAASAADDPAGWGEESHIDPPAFLVDALFGRRDDLAEFITRLVFSPIGEEDGRSA